MKILYIITKSNWGGAQRHVFDLATYFKDKGHDVVVALGGEGILNDRLIERGVRTLSIKSMKRDVGIIEDSASFGAISRIIHGEKPDIIHLHSSKAGGLGALAGRLLRVKKIIYTIHGSAMNEDRPWYQKISIAFFTWMTMLLSTHVITISEKELGQSQMFPLVSKKLRMVYLGITPPKFLSEKDARAFMQSKTTETIDKKVVIGIIAELHTNKGLIYAINALEKVLMRFPDTFLYIIGEGEQRSYLESLIKEKKLEHRIILVGYVDNASQYLKGFNIFLLSSVKEGLPYTLIEAGYASLPVVATTVGGIAEIIEDMKSGILVQSKKSTEIAHAIEFFLEHKPVQKEYGKALRTKVSDIFTIGRMLTATENIYLE